MLKNTLKALVVVLLMCACAHSDKTPVASDMDIKAKIAEDDQKIARAYQEQWDILAQDELLKSADSLKKAKAHEADGDSYDKTATQLTKFDESYAKAEKAAASYGARFQALLAARKKVLESGIRQFPDDNKKFAKLDEEFRDIVDNRKVDVKDYTDLQQQYLQLSGQMTKNINLMNAKAQVEDAKKNKAAKYAPVSLNRAELDIKNAEVAIDTNMNNVSAYAPLVKRANRSAANLAAVVAEQKKVNYELNEAAAQKIVNQSGSLDRLNFDLAVTNSELMQSQDKLNQTNTELRQSQEELQAAQIAASEKERKLSRAEAEIRFQAALDSAQKQFSNSEADVYRQGNKILIRLKSIGFASGKADLPSTSKPMLDKVAGIAQQLNSSEVVVEGHTDSVGSAEVNNAISQKRAESVVSYLSEEGLTKSSLQAVGYGYQKPLTSNKTKEGRAQNRRVDVWITPETVTTN